jgi:hypothetical protein
MKNKYNGPYKIIRSTNHNAAEIELTPTKTSIVNFVRLTGLFCKLTHIITVTLANDNRRNNDFFLKAILY